MSLFKPAQRAQAKIRLAIAGPSGSGKTYSALLIARGLVGIEGKIAVIDTERRSASLYAHITQFDTCELGPPFTPERYIAAIRDAEQGGYNAIVIDSLSHAWAGPGGILDLHDAAAAKERNSFAAWRLVTPRHNDLVDAMLQSKCHIIVTLRSKTEYAQTEEGGRKRVVKLGLAPIQRDGLEYEFTVFLDLDASHNAVASKDRTSLFDGLVFRPDESMGHKLAEWLASGVPTSPAQEPEKTPVQAPAAQTDAPKEKKEKPAPESFAGQVKVSGEPRKYRRAFAVQALLGDKTLVLLGDVGHLKDNQTVYVEGDRVKDRVGVKTLTMIEMPSAGEDTGKPTGDNSATFKGQVVVLGTPVEGAQGLEVQALAGEENIVLIGDKVVQFLTEGSTAYIEGTRTGDQVSVFLIKPDTVPGKFSPVPENGETGDEDLVTANITSEPKKTYKTMEDGSLKEILWVRGEVAGREVLIVGNDAIESLAPGQTVRVRGELVRNEKGQEFLKAQEILTA